MEKDFNINDYYLGIILATPEYLNNRKKTRMLAGVSYDPFLDVSFDHALIFGVPTLLKKDKKNGEEIYVDQHNSRYKNELTYQVGQANTLGIVLAYVKPFTYSYHEECQWYCEEDIEENNLYEEVFLNHTYYISYSKKNRDAALIIVEEEPMNNLLYEYLRNLLGEEDFFDMLEKSKEYKKEQ